MVKRPKAQAEIHPCQAKIPLEGHPGVNLILLLFMTNDQLLNKRMIILNKKSSSFLLKEANLNAFDYYYLEHNLRIYPTDQLFL